MAAHNRMAFGTHIVFTYGPLGFLTVQQLNYSATAVAAYFFTLALSTAVFAALIWSLRRAVPLVVAIVVAYLVGSVSLHAMDGPEYVLGFVFVICVAVLSRADDDPAPWWIWVSLGSLLGIFSLVKVSLGVGTAAALIVTVAFVPHGRGRAIGALAVGAASTFFLSWFGTGNGFGNMVPFARSSTEVISGYSAAMSIEDPSRRYAYWLAAIVAVLIGLFAVAHGRRLQRRSRIGIGVLALVVTWLLFKEGFVRHDYHDLIFFAVAPLILVALTPGRRSWMVVPGVLALTGMTAIVVGGTPSFLTRPDVAVRNFSSEAATLASTGRTAAVIDQSRRSLRYWYAIPNRMVVMMSGQTVDISPWEPTVAWAYPQLRFDPLPVITDYNAYTPWLDQLDTSYLASPDSPRFILRQNEAIDGRDPAFEPPNAQLAIECRYRQVAVDAAWQLLERGADRCGSLSSLGTVTTGFEHWVSVPRAPTGDAIVAKFQLAQGWWSGLQTILYKPPEVSINFSYGARTQSWRFVAATAPDLHVIQVASTLGYSSAFVPVAPGHLMFSIEGGSRSAAGVRVSFYGIHEAAPANGTGGPDRGTSTSSGQTATRPGTSSQPTEALLPSIAHLLW